MKYWKYRVKGRRKPHLSRGDGTGSATLCGIDTNDSPIVGLARTITELEGDECRKCAKRSEWTWEPLVNASGRIYGKHGRQTYPLNKPQSDTKKPHRAKFV